VCAEASTVGRAVAADFFFDCGDVVIPANKVFIVDNTLLLEVVVQSIY
jgi:hypothetical protein